MVTHTLNMKLIYVGLLPNNIIIDLENDKICLKVLLATNVLLQIILLSGTWV